MPEGASVEAPGVVGMRRPTVLLRQANSGVENREMNGVAKHPDAREECEGGRCPFRDSNANRSAETDHAEHEERQKRVPDEVAQRAVHPRRTTRQSRLPEVLAAHLASYLHRDEHRGD